MDKSLKLKIKLNTTAAWFRKVVVCVVEFMSVSPREIMFEDGLKMKIHISNRNRLNT